MKRFSSDALHRIALVVSIVVLPAACGGGSESFGVGIHDASGRAQLSLGNGLVQRVAIEPATPGADTDIQIRSVIVNTAGAPIAITLRMCGFDLSGTLALGWPPGIVKCQAYSGIVTLAAGDSLVAWDCMRVSSPPGKYELRVRHVLSPEMWLHVPVTVR